MTLENYRVTINSLVDGICGTAQKAIETVNQYQKEFTQVRILLSEGKIKELEKFLLIDEYKEAKAKAEADAKKPKSEKIVKGFKKSKKELALTSKANESIPDNKEKSTS